MMKVDLEGKVALVTGAARGIGRAIAAQLAANGAKVVFADIDFAGAKSVAAELASGIPLRMNVADEGEVETAIAQVLAEYGRIDILVNNAGVNSLERRVTIDQFALAEWDRIVRVDLTGLFLVSRAVARPMITQRAGRIINIASVVGLVPLRLQCAFVAAKAGVVNLTRAMALELGPNGVLVNCICPGSILTEPTRQIFYGKGKLNEQAEKLLAHIPLGRPGAVEEVAPAALFLAAPESSYINGAVLTVDGGWTAGYTREF